MPLLRLFWAMRARRRLLPEVQEAQTASGNCQLSPAPRLAQSICSELLIFMPTVELAGWRHGLRALRAWNSKYTWSRIKSNSPFAQSYSRGSVAQKGFGQMSSMNMKTKLYIFKHFQFKVSVHRRVEGSNLVIVFMKLHHIYISDDCLKSKNLNINNNFVINCN